MIRRTSAILIFTALLCSLASPPRAALADEPAVSGPAYAPDEIIVVFNETVDAPAAEAALDIIDAVGAETIDTPDDAITELVELPPDVSVAEAILELSRDPDVAFVQPNYIYTLADYAAAATPNDPYYGVAGYRWHLDKIDADEAWEILPKNGSAVRVAVIDYSPDITHPDLAGNIAAAAARDFSKGRGNSYPSDYNNHGTHVAGIIGAVSNNGIGVAGVATGGSNDVIEVIPINVFDSEGKAYTSSLIPAMTYGVSAGAKIINLSLGVEGDPYNYDAKLKSAVDAAVFGGVTVVCAAGNDGKLDGGEYANYPSHFASVISVVSTTSSDGRSSTSNYSDADNFVSAPGVSIYSTAAGGGYTSLTGTSMAAPVTSGVVAMMLYVNPDLTPATVLNILKTTSAGPSNSTRYGGRRIDADAAVAAAKALRSISGSARISGAAKYGETLKAAVDGVPNDAGALSYAWKRDDAAIAGANTDAYTLTGDDIGRKIGVTVTAANYPNSALESAQTAAVEKADAPVVTAWPSASGVTYGQPLSYSTLSGGKISVGGGAFAWKEPNAVPTVLNNGYAVIFTPDAPTASLYKPIEAPEETVSVTVSKADAPEGVNQSVSIIKGQTRDFDLASLLPNLPGLADARYAPAITSDDGKILGALNYSSGGTLNLSVLPGATAGNTATVAVTVSSGNYNDFEAEITVTAVDKTDVTISGLTAAGGVYNGSAYAGYSGSATFTQNGVGAVNPGNATLTPRYTGTTASGDAYNSGEAPSLAGSYTVTLALENDGMYYGRWTGSFTVEKAEPSLPSALTAVYGQTLADVELPGGAALVWNDVSASVGDAGTRYFKASYTPSDTANYKTLPDVQVKVEVGRKPLTIGVSALDRTYDGTMSVALQIGALSGVLPEDEEYVSCGVEASAADKNAGSAKAVTASLSLTGARAGNYSIAQTAELTVNIAPKEITADDITLGSPGRTYNGGVAASFTAQFKSGVIATGDKVTLTLTGEYDTADIGSNKTITITGWSLSGGDAGNYVLAGEHPATAIGAITQQTSSGGGSGGGGLSLSPSAGESESESETPSGGPVSVSYTQTGGSVAVDLPDSKVSEIIVKADATATIDVSKASGAAAASLPAAALVKFADAGLAVEIKLPQGSVTLEPDAAKSLAEQAGGSVSVKLAAVSASSLNASQREAVKNAPVFDISVSSGDVAVTSFDGAQIRVSLPHALESGQSPENVVVRYIDDVGGARDMETSYDSRAQMVSFTTDHLSLYAIAYDDTPVPQPWRNPFADVREGDWFYSDVEYAYTSGLMDGVTATEFSPNAPISRAMLVTILYRHAGAKLETGAGDAPFYDVPADQWYSEAVAWASASGIVNGVGGNKFAPDENVTREQFAAILLRYAEFAGDGPQGGWAVRLDFTDVGEISDWATEGAMYCFMRGVITGKPGNLFDPRGGATRAEASAMMRRYIENAK